MFLLNASGVKNYSVEKYLMLIYFYLQYMT